MLMRCANVLVECLYRHCNLQMERRAVYIYGSQLLFSTTLSVLSILVITALLPKPYFGGLFILIFIGLRIFVGGFHAKTYQNCFLITNTTFVATVLAAHILSYFGNSQLTFSILVSSTIVIWVLTPIRNKYHPLSDKTYLKNKKFGRALVVTEGLISTAIYSQNGNIHVFSIVSASIVAVAVMMIIPKILERRVLHG